MTTQRDIRHEFNLWFTDLQEDGRREGYEVDRDTEWRSWLAREYTDKIGYDPFADDPTIDPETVRQTLAEYDAEAARG